MKKHKKTRPVKNDKEIRMAIYRAVYDAIRSSPPARRDRPGEEPACDNGKSS